MLLSSLACFRLYSTPGKARFTRLVRTVSRRSKICWSSGKSCKCLWTTLVRNCTISRRSTACPGQNSKSPCKPASKMSSSLVYKSFFSWRDIWELWSEIRTISTLWVKWQNHSLSYKLLCSCRMHALLANLSCNHNSKNNLTWI